MESIKLILQAIKERNLPVPVALLLAAAAGYIIFPADLIPDFAFPASAIDDILIAALMIGMGGRILTNKKLTNQNRAKSDDDEVIDI